MKLASIVLLFLLLAAGCGPKENGNFEKLIGAKPYTVAMFIAPDCPLCKTLSTPFAEMSQAYPDIQFLGVMSGQHYEAMELNMFATETKFEPAIFRDYDYAVAHQLGAGITPEFFLIDSTGSILYSGMMDDRILSLGNYKQTWDELYLKDALDAVLHGKKPVITKTEAIGCVLEY